MPAWTKEEMRLIRLKNAGLTDEQFLAMDEVEFRARFRERCHHTLEIQLYSCAYRGDRLIPNQTDYVRRLMGLWERRGLSKELADYRYAAKLIEFADQVNAGKTLDLSPYAPREMKPEDTELFYRIVKERRSVREFKDIPVPDELIDKVLEAGLWAAHSCNLQSIRYLVVREDKMPGLFIGSDIPGGPVHLVVCQDQKTYLGNETMTERNYLLDSGAAAQNIVLAAHAVGLAGVWLTFNEEIMDRLRKAFSLPVHIRIVTYVDIGYGDQDPYPPQRDSVENHVLGRTPL